MAGTPSPRRSHFAWLALAIGAGIALRLDQIASQLLLEDEWHAVYRVAHQGALAIFLDFGHSDSSIPLTLLYLAEAQASGLSELAMRWPMLAAGIATLALFPAYVARRFRPGETLLFAALLAISPLLFFYSRMARPYALTLLLVYAAHVSFRRYASSAAPRGFDATAYAASATLAAWLHPIVVPFLLGPFAPAAWRWLNSARGERKRGLLRLATLAVGAGVPMGALLTPPLLAHPESLSLKSGADLPRADTLVGIWYHWFGTGSSAVVALCVALAVAGASVVWRRLPEAPSLCSGVVLCAAAIVAARPAWIGNPLTLARYLLPVLPLLLLATACGALRIGRAIAAFLVAPGQCIVAKGVTGALAAAPLVALGATSPLAQVLAYPNANSLHLLYEFDFRAGRNPLVAHMAPIPLSPWWSRLAGRPHGSLAIAVAPFPLDSAGWDAPRWQRLSRQRILSGFLTGICATARVNEVPDDARFRFRNAVHLAAIDALRAHGVDYVAWQKPYRYVAPGIDVEVGADLAACGPALRARFGAPAYEDEWLAAYAVSVRAPDAK